MRNRVWGTGDAARQRIRVSRDRTSFGRDPAGGPESNEFPALSPKGTDSCSMTFANRVVILTQCIEAPARLAPSSLR